MQQPQRSEENTLKHEEVTCKCWSNVCSVYSMGVGKYFKILWNLVWVTSHERVYTLTNRLPNAELKIAPA